MAVSDTHTLASANASQYRRHANRNDTVKHVQKQPSQTFHDAWQSAEDAGEVPARVWRPSNRKNARPEHGLRAAFQAFLGEQGVATNVVDYLVGHEGESVRDVHYGRDLMRNCRAAVDLITPVNWGPASTEPA